MYHPKMAPCSRNWMKTQNNGAADAEVIHLSVREPVSYSPNPFTSFTSFAIYIDTTHPAFSVSRSAARRRYSEFRWLRRTLWRHHPHRTPPELPPICVLVWNRFNDAFIETRRAGLQRFLREVVCVPTYLGERALHLFLQTELPVRDIEANLEGLRDDTVTALCSHWPATPDSQDDEEEVVTSPQDIVPTSRNPPVTSCSVTSEASSNGGEFWSPPSGSSAWLPPRALPQQQLSTGLGTSLIC